MPTPLLKNVPPLPEERETRSRGWPLLALAGLMFLALLAGSLMPPHYKVLLHTHGRFHSWIHVVAFGALAFVAVRSVRSVPARLLMALGCFFFGCAIEITEAMTYHAAFEWGDVVTDALGIAFATALALYVPIRPGLLGAPNRLARRSGAILRE